MTNEEAKGFIAECRNCKNNINGTCNDSGFDSGCFEAHKIAVDAIYKQIPKGLTIQAEVDPKESKYVCPNCGRFLGFVMYGTESLEFGEVNYCPGCGQAIKYESQKLNYADEDTAQSGLQSAT